VTAVLIAVETHDAYTLSEFHVGLALVNIYTRQIRFCPLIRPRLAEAGNWLERNCTANINEQKANDSDQHN